jgi:hypothetical protein
MWTCEEAKKAILFSKSETAFFTEINRLLRAS